MFGHSHHRSGCHRAMRHAMRGGWGHGRHGHGWSGRGGGWGGPGRGGPRGRMFDGGELRLVLLKLIADEPRHGYDLIRAIEALTQGAYAPSPGVVYPKLTLLADMGAIEEAAVEGARKPFAITAAGAAMLDEAQEQVAALIARLAALGEERSRTEATSIRRAKGNLREVLQNRLGGGDVDDATLHRVVALIDEAAQKIERL